ncbi:MAG: hypothetical protein IPI22_01915 [Bacteroidetes bacterium]|nr:hypothetical protein [Bacteroidota bacterium]
MKGKAGLPFHPDLTTNDKSKQQASGGVITQKTIQARSYCTIFAAVESPVEKTSYGVGVMMVSYMSQRDGGKIGKM